MILMLQWALKSSCCCQFAKLSSVAQSVPKNPTTLPARWNIKALNISCDSLRLKPVSSTEEMEEKRRATFFTGRYFVHFKKENVPVRSHYVMCANIQRLFSLHSAKVEMCDDGKKKMFKEKPHL